MPCMQHVQVNLIVVLVSLRCHPSALFSDGRLEAALAQKQGCSVCCAIFLVPPCQWRVADNPETESQVGTFAGTGASICLPVLTCAPGARHTARRCWRKQALV